MRLPYRRRRATVIPIILGIVAVLLLGVGAAIVFVSLSGAFEPTPTATITASPTIAPTFTASITATITETPGPSPTPTDRPVLTYTVETGDTLFAIADKFQIAVDQLVAANNLGTVNIQAGQTLTIPPPSYKLPTDTPLPTGLARNAKLFYTVKPGDTLIGIANKYQTTTESILERNKDIIRDPNSLPAGAVLEVRWGLAPWTPTLPGFTVTPTAGTPGPPTATGTKSP